MRSAQLLPAAIAWLACSTSFAQQPYVALEEHDASQPRTATRQFPLAVGEAETRLYLDAHIALTAGKARLRLLGPDGEVLRDDATENDLTFQATLPVSHPGTYHLELDQQAAAGTVQVHVYPLHPAAAARTAIAAGLGIVLVVGASVLYFRRKSRAGWRWLWVGAAIWTVGVGLKFAWAVPLNAPILRMVKHAVPPAAYLPIAALYIGLLTGIFEIGVTLLAGFIWRKMAADAPRAVGVGVGAGAFEALLLGLASLSVGAVVASGLAPDALTAELTAPTLMNSAAWLCGPVERIIAILCHTSSRALTLLTVATRRWRYFWLGFALMTVLDGIAGYFLLSGAARTVSAWWIELAIAPFGIAGVPIILWCVRRWPAASAPQGEPAVTPGV